MANGEGNGRVVPAAQRRRHNSINPKACNDGSSHQTNRTVQNPSVLFHHRDPGILVLRTRGPPHGRTGPRGVPGGALHEHAAHPVGERAGAMVGVCAGAGQLMWEHREYLEAYSRGPPWAPCCNTLNWLPADQRLIVNHAADRASSMAPYCRRSLLLPAPPR